MAGKLKHYIHSVLEAEQKISRRNIMKVKLVRLSDSGNSTIGALYVDGNFQCYTLEDTYREKKIQGETRIPAGTYPIKLRTKGRIHRNYLDRYGKDFHKGTLELQNVPGFQWILIHCGNRDSDTSGCILVGNIAGIDLIKDSRLAYKPLYMRLCDALMVGHPVSIEVVDFDRQVKEEV